LKAMAYGMNIFNTEKFLLCPMIDARRMEVYCMVLSDDMGVVQETEALILSVDSFREILKGNKVIFFGNGADKAMSLLGNNENARFVGGISPLAVHVGALAVSKLINNEFEDLAYFEPFYLKDFVGPK